MKSFSIFEYLYRDAANYKAWGFLLLEGHASDAMVEDLRHHFESQEFFIAEQLNIPPLYSELWAFSNGPTGDDHVWHTFYSLRAAKTHEAEGQVFGTVEQFVRTVCAVRVWDEKLSPHWSI